ncbi:formimidoylglutamate deiminase [Ruegeria sp. Ofav3-42]|uniref:formimidoylglutamate deiminase n=1 Tax=Ruegeria sp. Ofav3-42 TaxID=2917759 RepID=UPI001EF43558|nr:formimidoylglutamate deiminase [Ruegeria sp. Ofav3-42]MCG7520572.1 formimidoylglutamate deiminase [Ruegeria sp. Ofav3-42]
MSIHAKTALLGSDWVSNLRVEIEHGQILNVQTGTSALRGDTQVDVLLPALGNLHSHAFQRAMAGMTEVRAAGRESFWTWRTLMYRFLDKLTPDHVEAIAALVFMEMQEAGYSSVGEFHYVHHEPGGTPYDRMSELSQRVFSAANQTGIGLTHLPVLYTYGGVEQQPLTGGQLRFGNAPDRFLHLVEECRAALPHTDSVIGIAPHSLRATSPTDLQNVLHATPNGPVHIHIAEQVKEVADVEAALGQRPVAWLLDNAEVDHRWCLIHATHMTDEETRALAQSGAVAGLCPITEANLGDGIFNGAEYINEGGRFGVGSDSNIRISLPEELRTLEYSQRLRDQSRTVLVKDEGSVGQALYTASALGGAQALGRNAGEIAVGKLADLVAIDRTHPTLCALTDEQLLDGLSFAAPDGLVTDLWSAGRHMVQQGRHVYRDRIIPAYRSAIADLLADV